MTEIQKIDLPKEVIDTSKSGSKKGKTKPNQTSVSHPEVGYGGKMHAELTSVPIDR